MISRGLKRINQTTKIINILSLVVGLIFFGACGLGFADPANTDPLTQMDRFFRDTYHDASEHTLRGAGPIILAIGEDLTLFLNGDSLKSVPPPDGYGVLTTVSHITLTIFLMLEPYGEGPVATSRIERFGKLHRLANEVKAKLNDRLPEDLTLATAQQRVIEISCSLIEKIIAEKQWSRKELDVFLKGVKPQILRNVKLAAKFRIDHFHRQIAIWKKDLSQKDWERLHVVVSGPAMPRKNNLAVQYFSKLFGIQGEGSKIIYAESVFQQQQALQMLGTSLLDGQIGEGYFGDPWRMHRDLLGNAAAVYLDEITLSLPE